MITIRKAVASPVRPDQILAGLEALKSGSGPPGSGPGGDAAVAARLRDLALHLASFRDLRVSVITYEDGSAELEVLHAGPPHHTAATIDRGKFAGQPAAESGWVVDLTGEAALEHATELIRGALLAASAP
ncbi:MAG: hypothetical protein ACRDPD_24820 [Streptosporangiaceae bacterium]